MQTETGKERKTLNFEESLKTVLSGLQGSIKASGAKIEYDFTECAEAYYIPAYLESIFQNMVTNAIKYRHPDRKPFIRIRSARIRHHIYLYFEDNGLGIDLDKHGDSIFGMYKTFHHNPDAKGIGLFMTRNQIETMGGSIDVASTVNEGTKFTVKLV
jgi:signal transduction histidine kinase